VSINDQHIFPVSAGSNSFYLLAQMGQTTDLSLIGLASVSAVYFPTSYGTVSGVIPLAEAGAFEHATRVEPMPGMPDTQPLVVVDMRELEMRALRAEAAAEKARRELAEQESRRMRQAPSIVQSQDEQR